MKQKYLAWLSTFAVCSAVQTFQFGDETSRQTSTMSLTLEKPHETIEMILF